jgi:hypothetical protein
MAERKAALRRTPSRPELQVRLDQAKKVVLSEEELQEQRASFAYGNAPKGSRITKTSAIEATKRIRLTVPQRAM